MQIQFLGATRTVTGSKYLIIIENRKYLVDCGLFQGLKELRLRNWEKFPIDPATINAVFLTHAHLDHSGYLPVLVKDGFTGKIYSTDSTKDLSKIILLDSGHLQEEEANRANRYGYSKHKPALPLYTRKDAELTMQHFAVAPFDKELIIDKDLILNFKRAGHILGAASILLKHENSSILFSGDVGRPADPCIFPPEDIENVDYLVIESTYGDRLHEKVDPQTQLGECINKTVKRGGTVIIPAFTVGRTQNILYYLFKLKQTNMIGDIPIFLDSPMAQEATEIMLHHLDEHKLPAGDCEAACRVAHQVTTVDESKKIDSLNYPKIIISASGMATGGRVLHHIKAFAGDSRNTILFAGYQAAGTRGEAMVHGKKDIKMFGEIVTINAEVVSLENVSAHADYEEILAWLKKMPKPPKKIFLTHGEVSAAETLKTKIETELGYKCVIPDYLQTETL